MRLHFVMLLFRIVLRNMEGIQLLFLQETPPTVSEDSKFTASQIGLVVLAAIILVGGILATIFIFRKKKRYIEKSLYIIIMFLICRYSSGLSDFISIDNKKEKKC